MAAAATGRARRGRLSRSADFERVYRQGRSRANRWLVLYRFPRAGAGDEPRVGFSVSRRVGGAVDRNLVKRLLREASRELGADLPPGEDVVLVARPELLGLAQRDGLAGVRGALADLLGVEGAPAPPDAATEAPADETSRATSDAAPGVTPGEPADAA